MVVYLMRTCCSFAPTSCLPDPALQAGHTALHLLVLQAAAQPDKINDVRQVLAVIHQHVGHTRLREVDVPDRTVGTPLLLALEKKQEELANAFLLQFRFNPAATSLSDGSNALHLAINTGNIKLVKTVIQVRYRGPLLLTVLYANERLCNPWIGQSSQLQLRQKATNHKQAVVSAEYYCLFS